LYCTAEEDAKNAPNKHRRLYKNLEWLRDKFQNYKRNKSQIKTENNDEDCFTTTSYDPEAIEQKCQYEKLPLQQKDINKMLENRKQIVYNHTRSKEALKPIKPIHHKKTSSKNFKVGCDAKRSDEINKKINLKQKNSKLEEDFAKNFYNTQKFNKIKVDYSQLEIQDIAKQTEDGESLELDNIWPSQNNGENFAISEIESMLNGSGED